MNNAWTERPTKLKFGMKFPSNWVIVTNHMCMCTPIGHHYDGLPKTHSWTNQAQIGHMESKYLGRHY